VHLLITPTQADSASLTMKHLGQRYVQYINRSHRRSGTLWKGCFRSCLVRETDYLLSCYRYIELNPVRAAMVVHPRDYRWSSYRVNGEGQAGALITPHPEYLHLGRDALERLDSYRALFRAQIEPEMVAAIRTATNGNYVLGSPRFQDEIAFMLQRRVAPGLRGRPRRSSQADGAVDLFGDLPE
jgi:putative transposase